MSRVVRRSPLFSVLALGPLLCCVACSSNGTGSPDGSTSDSGSLDAGHEAVGYETAPVNEATDVGRYWALVQAHGSVGANPLTVWFEQKQASEAWAAAQQTPEHQVDANTEGSTLEEWLIGLAPGTTYQVRVCFRDERGSAACGMPQTLVSKGPTTLPWVVIDPGNPRHLALETGAPFVPWGNNYVFPTAGPANEQIEDAMDLDAGLARIDADLTRLLNLAPPDGATNVIRMHLQLHTFLLDATTPNRRALAHYAKVVELAEDRGLYVMVTGLNYFFPRDNPVWVARQTEAEHWNTQAIWWNAMASALRHSSGVFAYDLMNEPYVTGGSVDGGYARWTTVPYDQYCQYGEQLDAGVHGICFGQYVSTGLLGRAANETAGSWTQKMKEAIRTTRYAPNDSRHLVTVGAGAFGLNNAFHASAAVKQQLDFFSPHLYPEAADNGLADINLAAALSASGKPVIPGETFTFGPVRHLITRTCLDGTTQGWFGQYDGRVLGDPCQPGRPPLTCAFFDEWYKVQSDFGPTMRAGNCPALVP